MCNIKEQKKALRKELFVRRRNLLQNSELDYSKIIFEKIYEMDAYKNAKCIMCYVSYGDELPTFNFINHAIADGKIILTPICNPDHTMTLAVTKTCPEGFVETKMGILEIPIEDAIPMKEEEIDVIITPGLSFTLDGKRMGYGGGFYDRMFEKIRPDCLKLCPTYDGMISDDLVTDVHDCLVDILVSETRTVFISK